MNEELKMKNEKWELGDMTALFVSFLDFNNRSSLKSKQRKEIAQL